MEVPDATTPRNQDDQPRRLVPGDVLLSYGHFSKSMLPVIREHVTGKVVWDFGCGPELKLAHQLLELGASRIVGVDREPYQPFKNPAITVITDYFVMIPVPEEGIDVAFISWPTNYRLHGLLDFLEASRVIIYLGSNTGGSACGWSDLYNHFQVRELLDHVPDPKNSLLVLGAILPDGKRRRLATPEEIGATTGNWMTFQAAVDLHETLRRVLADVPAPPDDDDPPRESEPKKTG